MPLSFANPALLLGSLAAALPVIIHFLSRRRVQRRQFSDLRFLSEVQARQARSLGIRRWLLLLLRVLAILLLTVALAGPRWGGLAGGARDRPILFVIDTSASMSTQMEQGTRLEAALTACRRMIAALPGGTEVQVLTSGSRTGVRFGDWLPAGTVPVDALGDVQASDGAFDLAGTLRAAADLVSRAPGPGVDLVLISDLQKVRFQPDLQEAAARLAAAGQVQVLIDRIGEEVRGGAIMTLDLPGRAVRPGESITVGALVRPDLTDQVFVLELDGRPVAETVAEGPPQGIRPVSFSLTVPGPGFHRGVIRKQSDLFPADDSRPFVLAVPRQIPVILAHGRDRPGDGAPGRGGWRILEQALAPGTARSLFGVSAVTSDELTSGILRGAGLVALVDPDPMGRRSLEGLVGWLQDGGALLLLAGDPTLQGYLQNNLLPALGLPPGPVRFNSIDQGRGRRTMLVSGDHPMLRGFDREALGTIEEIRWHRWFSLPEGEARTLLTLVGGDPLLIEGDLGDGRFALLGADLRPENGSLAGSSMALPLLQRLGAYLAAGPFAAGAAELVAGDEAVLALPPGDRGTAPDRLAGAVARFPDGEADRAASLGWVGSRPLLKAGIADRAGFVTFLAGADTLGSVAVGLPLSESGLSLYTPGEWRELMRLQGLPVGGDLTAADPGAFAAVLAGSDLTPWLLALAVLTLLTELVVGRGASAPKVAASG